MTRLVIAPDQRVRRGRVGAPVEVRRRDDAPEQFLWQGRLYLVRAVLNRWTESGGWWRSDPSDPSGPAGPLGAGSLSGIDDGEQEWWRVEAGTGRHAALSAGLGVYDLCFTWTTGDWSLVRVQD